METVTFALSCIAVFTIGVLILFPEVIDYTDTIVKFFIIGLATTFALLGINLFVKGLLPNYISNNNIKLKGRLL
jgi:hypothetical protein